MLDPYKHSTLIRRIFVSFFILLYVFLNIAATSHIFNEFSQLEAIYLVLVMLVNLGIAYELAEWISARIVRMQDLPKLSYLTYTPPVAVLYLTYNDFNSNLVSQLRYLTYPAHTVFILDDSTQSEYKTKVDQCGFKVIRRSSRENYKAGNLNHWLSYYADQFDYFIVLDNDSLISEKFVDEMVSYGEHPDNHNIAIFQSTIEIWNKAHRFARILGLARSLRSYVSDRLDNPCKMTFPTTNNLVRTSAICEIGGFSVRAPTIEDWATGLDLMEKGYDCQKVNVRSYVSMSTSVQMHTKRMARWASGLLELAKSGKRNLPFTAKLRFYMGIYFYLIWPIYITTLIFVTIWGYQSTWGDLTSIDNLFRRENHFLYFRFYPSLVLFVYYVYYFLLRPVIACKTGTPLEGYFQFVLLTAAVGLYAFVPLLKAQFMIVIGKQHEREIVNRPSPRVSLFILLKEMKLAIGILGVLILGLVRNPAALIFNFPWLIPFFISPIILYLWQQPAIPIEAPNLRSSTLTTQADTKPGI